MKIRAIITLGLGVKARPGIEKQCFTSQRYWDMIDNLLLCLQPTEAFILYIKKKQKTENPKKGLQCYNNVITGFVVNQEQTLQKALYTSIAPILYTL